jgi:hypothetical protein
MKAVLYYLNEEGKLKPSQPEKNTDINDTFQLALCFSSKKSLENQDIFQAVSQKFPGAEVIICSTAGEINQNEILDDSLVVAALSFSKTKICTAWVRTNEHKNSFDMGSSLVEKLPKEGLKYIMLFSDGSLVNGSELVKGVNHACGDQVIVTGGLAGDGREFRSTLIGLNAKAESGLIVGIGFYGNDISIGHGTKGGWENFGPERTVTRSKGNILYEINEKSALELYKRYLGDESRNLPSSAFLFPLSLKLQGKNSLLVRTILNINEAEGSMTFAGDIPEGSTVRFMRSNSEKLTEAASEAAKKSLLFNDEKPDFSLIVSCVGRRIALGYRAEEEVEAINDEIGSGTVITGFYSYGEIAPFDDMSGCELHNQTISVTSFYENE